MAENEKMEVDASGVLEIDGVTYYPLAVGPKLNPCAGKRDNESCGPGCVCRGGQCFYTTFRLRQMGVSIPL